MLTKKNELQVSSCSFVVLVFIVIAAVGSDRYH
jgi:hypothetical protein